MDRAGQRSAGFRLILVALPVLAPTDVPLRGVDGTVDLLVVLMVGVALAEPRHFVDPLVGLLRVLLGVGLRLLLQVIELAHTILLCPTGLALRPGSRSPARLPPRRALMRRHAGRMAPALCRNAGPLARFGGRLRAQHHISRASADERMRTIPDRHGSLAGS